MSLKSQNQMARIYDVSVENFPGKVNALGEPYYALIAKAYMVRTEANRDQILEIEAGIKKEVSVGCSVHESICSVCGKQKCFGMRHVPGQVYDGKLCYTILHDAQDAYEWSFVAVRTASGRDYQTGRLQSRKTEHRSCGRQPEHKMECGLDREETGQLKELIQNLLRTVSRCEKRQEES